MTMPAIEMLLRQPAAQAVAWALLQFVWQGAAVGAITALALFALRRSASDIRYVVASIGLALMLTLPVVTGVQKFQALGALGEPADAVGSVLATAKTDVSRHHATALSAGGLTPAAASKVPTVAFAAGTVDALRAIQFEPLLPSLMLIWLIG